MKGLSIERLATFCSIVESGSIVEAARGDSVRQSQFSRQLKELENALGTLLFHRKGRVWELTGEGRKLALLTRSYFDELTLLASGTPAVPRMIRVGAGESILDGLIFPKMGELRQAFPSAIFEFSSMPTKELIAELNSGSLDLVIVREEVVESEHNARFFHNLQFKLVVPRSLLHERMPAGLKDIQDIPIAMLSGRGSYASAMSRLADQAGIRLRIAVCAQSFPQMCHLMKSGNFAGVLPSWHTPQFASDQFSTITLDSLDTLSRKLVLVRHKRIEMFRTDIARMTPKFVSLLA